MRLSRSEFQAAIEDGIREGSNVSPGLSTDQQEALREVGRTTTRCARGDYLGPDDCGCPATLAGLVKIKRNEDGAVIECESVSNSVTRFAMRFDSHTRKKGLAPYEVGHNAQIVEVVG
jgi:hypothetical protein